MHSSLLTRAPMLKHLNNTIHLHAHASAHTMEREASLRIYEL